MDKNLIRNFSIIAHIDHGKSTLADRILEITGAISKRDAKEQLLDDMELERERGITIKASVVTINYQASNQKNYTLNLIDTPGHVDFTYEVSKSLAACEGAVLVVDAAQGVEAQTVANFYLAKDNNLKIIPVINKIDLPSADVGRVEDQLTSMFGFKQEEILLSSGKTGDGVLDVLERIVAEIPVPSGHENQPMACLIFDSRFDIFRGVIIFVRVMQGTITASSKIKFMQQGTSHKIEELGIIKNLKPVRVDALTPGEVGYIIANIRDPQEVIIGDTITDLDNPTEHPFPGYRKVKPLVFCGVYPINSSDFLRLREAMEKLRLSDSSFVYQPENSQSFGHGFRCGFLGLLHMEIVQERLEREYDLNLILTVPNVVYRIKKENNEILEIDNPNDLPPSPEIVQAQEPYVSLLMIVPIQDIEAVCNFTKSRRGIFESNEYLSQDRVRLNFTIPLSEIIVDFYDRIKSQTRGYGSIDYEFSGYQPTDLVKLEIALNEVICDAFSYLIHKERAYTKAQALVIKLKDLIPRQLFEVRIQAKIESRVIASERVRSVGKNVTAKCYGGDITRKRKLWDLQKKGKKRLKQFGKVQIPQEAFLEVLKI
ncbi:MAG: translation elongation factor 4, partial [Candidatus Omnitrophota bacterium]